MIYFADATDGRIKIGTARNVDERLSQISTHLATPVVLIGSIEGSYTLERHIHEHLAEYQIGREWFRDCHEVRRSIRNLILAGPRALGITESASMAAPERKHRVTRKIRPWSTPITFRDLVQFAAKEDLEEYLGILTGCDAETAAAWLNRTQPAPATALAAVLSDIFSRIDL